MVGDAGEVMRRDNRASFIRKWWKRALDSDDPFDRWFAKTILVGTHGMDPSQTPPPVNEVFVNSKF